MKRLIIDTETTGFSPRLNKILTIGMLFVDIGKNRLDVINQSHIFIKHNNYNATRGAMRVNKINLEQHNACAIPPVDACIKINSFIDKNSIQEVPIVGHNLRFDKGFISALFSQGNILPKFYQKSEDTMYIWREHQKNGDIPLGLKSNLKEITNFFRIDYTKAHDALADCHITARVYQQLLKLPTHKLKKSNF